MASLQPTFKEIRQQIKGGTPAPLYVLHGEEAYYIDELTKDFEALVPDEEKDFNLYILYGPQVEPDVVIDACLRYPMMAERQVVIVKEMQAVSQKANFLNALVEYAKRPNPQTVLVIIGRGEALTGASFMNAVKSSKGVVFKSDRLWESQIGPKIEELAAEAGLSVDAKAKAMLVEHVGSDLSRMHNEVRKLTLVLPKGASITPQVVEKLIGVSKEYNNFELVEAVAKRDAAKCYRIIEFFRKNPKTHPSIPVGATLFNFFAKMLLAFYAPEKSDYGIAAAIGSKPGGADVRRIVGAMRMYNARQVINAITACRRFDVRSKGVGSRMDSYDLLRELIFVILN
ncbi:MAG: DNA polymerase III subunit delta [Bacteroides sp.]|nr:DNA polymerase III subunit delta [Bacteroides sp.]MCM1379847.1 DNA polymerase III subunit delta [Bacteroides sp.]MCM1446121.1 DNA polymerase III subunit delta [Prevotella sp.]